MPLFSIVIPTHNRSNLLKICINSVLNQTVNDWELIVVDNGSTDNTREVVSSYLPERINYFHLEDPDRSVARNKGILESKGDYILFIDDDDYILENHLSVFQTAIENTKLRNTIFRIGLLEEKKGRKYEMAIFDPQQHKNAVNFAAFNMCSACSLCIPKNLLNDNQFPPKFPHWQDTHLILRLFAKYPIKQLPEFTYVYVQHENMGSENVFSSGISKKRIKLNIAAIEDLFDNYSDLVNPFIPSNTKRFLVAEKYLHYAIGDISNGKGTLYKEYFKKSLATNISFKYWKHYLVLLKKSIFKSKS